MKKEARLKGFKEEDKEKVIDFLNLVAKKAAFNDMSVQDNIQFFRLLSFMQQELIPKIEDNILEVIKLHEAKEQASEETAQEQSEQGTE